MDFEKSTNIFITKKIIGYCLLNNFLFNQLAIYFSALLLCIINILHIFNRNNTFQIFVASENTEILMVSNFGWDCTCHTSLIALIIINTRAINYNDLNAKVTRIRGIYN